MKIIITSVINFKVSKALIWIILASFFTGVIIVFASDSAVGQTIHHPEQMRSEISQPKDTTEVDSVFLSLISLVSTIKTDSISEDVDSHVIETLDFLSSAYEETDFYTSGNGAQVPDNVDTPKFTAYSGTLPAYFHTDFHCPIPLCKITSPFGLRADGEKMHKGIDLSLHRGDTIVSALPGIVKRVGYERKGYGYFIIIDHPEGYQTRYAHLQKPLLKSGISVTAGTPIAIGGTSGNSSGPHLHFEIRYKDKPVDPTILLKKGWKNRLESYQSMRNKPDNKGKCQE